MSQRWQEVPIPGLDGTDRRYRVVNLFTPSADSAQAIESALNSGLVLVMTLRNHAGHPTYLVFGRAGAVPVAEDHEFVRI